MRPGPLRAHSCDGLAHPQAPLPTTTCGRASPHLLHLVSPIWWETTTCDDITWPCSRTERKRHDIPPTTDPASFGPQPHPTGPICPRAHAHAWASHFALGVANRCKPDAQGIQPMPPFLDGPRLPHHATPAPASPPSTTPNCLIHQARRRLYSTSPLRNTASVRLIPTTNHVGGALSTPSPVLSHSTPRTLVPGELPPGTSPTMHTLHHLPLRAPHPLAPRTTPLPIIGYVPYSPHPLPHAPHPLASPRERHHRL